MYIHWVGTVCITSLVFSRLGCIGLNTVPEEKHSTCVEYCAEYSTEYGVQSVGIARAFVFVLY